MHYDLLIVGGGLVGKSLASALANTPLNIALVDASDETRPDPRLIALNYGSVSFFESLGLWSTLAEQSAPIQEVHVSHRGRFGATRLQAEDLQLPALGHVIRAQQINCALDQRLRSSQHSGRFTEIRPARVKTIQLHEHHTTLTLEHQGTTRHISGRFIIGADGTYSTLRELLNFDTRTVDYQQSALVTTTLLGRPHENRAYQRFLEKGALAMLPLCPGEDQRPLCATIWTAGTETIKALHSLDNEAFIRTLQTHFGYRLGRLKSVSERHVFPLKFIHVKKPLQGNVLLIGNAAHTIHPIAAQGLNLALYEIAELSRTFLHNLKNQRPLYAGLAENSSRIQPKINLFFSHYLSQIFASDFWAANITRQLGMVGLDLCSPLKKQFSRLMAMESIQWSHPHAF